MKKGWGGGSVVEGPGFGPWHQKRKKKEKSYLRNAPCAARASELVHRGWGLLAAPGPRPLAGDLEVHPRSHQALAGPGWLRRGAKGAGPSGLRSARSRGLGGRGREARHGPRPFVEAACQPPAVQATGLELRASGVARRVLPSAGHPSRGRCLLFAALRGRAPSPACAENVLEPGT